MPLCARRTKVGVVLLTLTVLVTIQLWAPFDSTGDQPKYDAKYVQLLRDYQSKRTKKGSNVLIGTRPGSTLSALPLRANQPSPHLTLSQEVLSDVTNISWPVEDLKPTAITDLFIAVKTSGKFHETRLPLLLDTWIPFSRQSTYVITDVEDVMVRSRLQPGRYINSHCSNSHHRRALVCKVAVAYDLFMVNQRRWFCVADDDTYLNIPNLVSLLQHYDYTKDWYIGKPSLKYPIRVTIDNSKQAFWFHTGGAGYCISHGLALKMTPYARRGRLSELADRIKVPDDVALGYIINKKLGVEITRVPTFHSHLEELWRIDPHDLKNQITLSYGGPNNVISNVVNTGAIIPTYPPPSDPTRLKSVHCYMFRNARECLKFGVASL